MDRTILHIDLNNFFASVECKYMPELQNECMAVCGSVSDRHGIVLAKNQNAKNLGVKTGMTIQEAESICPKITFVEAHHERYVEWSKKVKALYAEYSDKIESFGIDEAWLDVTDNKNLGSGLKIANEIRERVKNEFGLTVSVGVSFNKVFAKLGSDMKKPDATTVIDKNNFKKLIWELPVDNLLYVGHATYNKFNKIGVKTIGDLANTDFEYISKYLGKVGENLWFYANGKDDSPVLNSSESEEIKSVGNSVTCYRDLVDIDDVSVMLSSLCESVSERLIKYNIGKANTITLSIRDSNLNWTSKQCKIDKATVLSDDLFKNAMKLFEETYKWSCSIRSLGVSVSDFGEQEQITLSSNNGDYEKKLKLMKTIGTIRNKYGKGIVLRALSYKDRRLTKEGDDSNKNNTLPKSHE